MTSGATVSHARADCQSRVYVAGAVAYVRAIAFRASELALKQLSPATDRAERIPSDDERGRIRSHPVSAPCTDLFYERLVYSFVGYVWRLSLVY